MVDPFRPNSSYPITVTATTAKYPNSNGRESSPIVFYSPNAIPKNLKLLDPIDGHFSSMQRSEIIVPMTRRISPAFVTSSALKPSTSLSDFLPSRFPTDDYDEQNLGTHVDRYLNRIATEPSATNACSSPSFFVADEENIDYVQSDPPLSSHGFPRSLQRRLSTQNKNLCKIFQTFRDQLERTKMAFRTSLAENDATTTRGYRRISNNNSRSFPISSASMFSIHNYWKSIMQRELRHKTHRQVLHL